MTIRPRRSALFLPASNPRALAKARTLACDVVILDLEDAVAPGDKAAARDAAVAAVRDGGFGPRDLVVRVNAADTPWSADDLAALREATPDAVLVPKVAGPADVAAYGAALAPGVPLWAMIESAAAVLRLDAIAATPPLACLILGPNDLAKDLRARPGADRLPLLPALMALVTAARAHGLIALDGVNNDLSGGAAFAEECAQAARFGFDGKTLIHPSQIAPCNAAFRPTAEMVAEARAIVAAYGDQAAAGAGAIRVDGRMVERLHLTEAERVLALAERA